MTTTPRRLTWALEQLKLRPEHRLLELGCGRGVLLEAARPLLTRGSAVGLDRSATATAAAARRLAGWVDAGELELRTETLEQATFAPGSFDRVLAVNVNHFWVRPAAAELEAIAAWLTERGELHLVYEPPAARLDEVAERVSSAVGAAGYDVEVIRELSAGAGLVDVIGRPARRGRRRRAPGG